MEVIFSPKHLTSPKRKSDREVEEGIHLTVEEFKILLKDVKSYVDHVKPPKGLTGNLNDQHEAVRKATDLMLQLEAYPLSYKAVSEPGCLEWEALQWVKGALRHAHPGMRSAAKRLGVVWLERVQSEYRHITMQSAREVRLSALQERPMRDQAARSRPASADGQLSSEDTEEGSRAGRFIAQLVPEGLEGESGGGSATWSITGGSGDHQALQPDKAEFLARQLEGLGVGGGDIGGGIPNGPPSPRTPPGGSHYNHNHHHPHYHHGTPAHGGISASKQAGQTGGGGLVPQPPPARVRSQGKHISARSPRIHPSFLQEPSTLPTKPLAPFTPRSLNPPANATTTHSDSKDAVAAAASPIKVPRLDLSTIPLSSSPPHKGRGTPKYGRRSFSQPPTTRGDTQDKSGDGEMNSGAHTTRGMRSRRVRSPESGQPGVESSRHRTHFKKVSVAVQVAPVQHHRFYFPESQAESMGSNLMFKYFDVKPPEAGVTAQELPERPRGLSHVDDKIRSDWFRLYYCDMDPPETTECGDGEGLGGEKSEEFQYAATPAFVPEENYWAETNQRKALELSELAAWAAALQPRTFVDHKPLAQLRSGLLSLLANQLKNESKEAASLYRRKEQQCLRQARERLEMFSQQVSRELDKLVVTGAVAGEEKLEGMRAVVEEQLKSTCNKAWRFEHSMRDEHMIVDPSIEQDMKANLVDTLLASQMEVIKLTSALEESEVVNANLRGVIQEKDDKNSELARDVKNLYATIAKMILDVEKDHAPQPTGKLMNTLPSHDIDAALTTLAPKVANRLRGWMNIAHFHAEDTKQSELVAALSKLSPEGAGKVLSNMTPERAARALRAMEAGQRAAALQAMQPDKAAQVLLHMEVREAAAALAAMEPAARAQALQAMDPAQAAALLSMMEDSAAVEALLLMPAAQAAKVIRDMSPDKAAELLAQMSDVEAGRLLEAMPAKEAAAVAANLPPAKLAGVLSSMPSKSCLSLLEFLNPVSAAQALMLMDQSTMHNVFVKLHPAKAANVVNAMKVVQAAEVLDNMEKTAGSKVMTCMGSDRCGPVMEHMSQETVETFLIQAESEYAAGVLSSMTPEAAARLAGKLDIQALVQIIRHMPPKKAAVMLCQMEETFGCKVIKALVAIDLDRVTGILAVMSPPEQAGSFLVALEAKEGSQVVSRMHATKAGKVLSAVDKSRAAAIINIMEDSSGAAKLLMAMELGVTIQVLNCMNLSKVSDIIPYYDLAKAARVISSLESSKTAEIIGTVCLENAQAAGQLMGAMEAEILSDTFLAFNPRETALVPLTTMTSAKAAEMMGVMELHEAVILMEAQTGEDPDPARAILRDVDDLLRKQMLQAMEKELVAILLGHDPDADQKKAIDMSSFQVTKLLGKFLEARQKKEKTKRWSVTSVLLDQSASSQEANNITKKLRSCGIPEMVSLLNEVLQSDEGWRQGAESINQTRELLLSTRKSVAHRQLSPAEVKEVLVQLQNKVDELLLTTFKGGKALQEVLRSSLKALVENGLNNPAGGRRGYLEGLFDPNILLMVQTMDQHQSLCGSALEYLRAAHGVESMVTEIGYDVEQDVDGDGQDDKNTYEDNVFVPRNKTENFPEPTPIGGHLVYGTKSAQIHINAADSNAMARGRFGDGQIQEVYPLLLPQDCPLRTHNHYGTFSVSGNEEKLETAKEDIMFLTQKLVGVSVAMKKGLSEQIAAIGHDVHEEKPDEDANEVSYLTKQKMELEKLLATKQMAMMVQEMRRYKKAPAPVVGVVAAVALLVNPHAELLNCFKQGGSAGGGQLPANPQVLSQIWMVVRQELNSAPGQSTGSALVRHMNNFAVLNDHVMDPPPYAVTVQFNLFSSLSKEALKRASSVAMLLFDWLSVVNGIINSQTRDGRRPSVVL